MSETGWTRAVSDPALEDLGLSGDLVTGEAVVLELRPASFATRALSFSIDLVVQLAVGIGLTVVVATVAPDADAAAVSAIVLGIWVATLVGWPVTVETVTRGRSLGKLAFGLRVVRDDGGPVRFRQALTRGLLAVVEIYLTFGSIALISSLANPRGKRVGDILAGTYVIRERTAARSTAPVSMPPELAGWARGADLGRILTGSRWRCGSSSAERGRCTVVAPTPGDRARRADRPVRRAAAAAGRTQTIARPPSGRTATPRRGAPDGRGPLAWSGTGGAGASPVGHQHPSDRRARGRAQPLT